jgi:RNA polymerase sigma factor (sigma-70 family)
MSHQANSVQAQDGRDESRRALEKRLEELLPRLRQCIRRHLRYHEALGDLRPRELEPEDLVIETVARALKSSYLPETRLYPWLCAIAYRVVEEEVRRRRLEHRYVVRSLEEPLRVRDIDEAFDETRRRLLDVLPAPGPLPEEIVERHEFQRYLEHQLSRLPTGPALALLYHDVEGMSYKEVASLLETTPNKVRKWVEFARAQLAAALVRDGWVEVKLPGQLFRVHEAPNARTKERWMAQARALAETKSV